MGRFNFPPPLHGGTTALVTLPEARAVEDGKSWPAITARRIPEGTLAATFNPTRLRFARAKRWCPMSRKAKSESISEGKTATDVRAFLPMEKCNFEIVEAAQVLRLSRSGIYDLITDGKLATFTHGRRRLVAGAELARVQAEFAAQATLGGSDLKPRRRTRKAAA